MLKLYFTEQQMQPLPTSIHSVTSWPPSLTVKGFSMSVAGTGQTGGLYLCKFAYSHQIL